MKRALVAIWLCGVAAACGGGGGGGTPTQPQPSITFTASGAAGPNSISLTRAPDSTPTRLRLTVHAEQLDGLFGVAFDLTFPNGVLRYDSAVAGSFLGGAPTSFEIAESPTGRLVVGITRLGAVSGVSGSGDLLTIDFVAAGAAGSEPIGFQASTAYDATATAIPGVTWIGGTANVAL